MKRRIAVLVVTYNPSIEALIYNINSYCHQVDKIILVDNSTSESKQREIENLEKVFANIFVLQFFDNLGIAKGQNFGMTFINSGGYDFVIEMDQDSYLSSNYVENLIKSFDEIGKNGVNKIAGVGGLPYNVDKNEVYGRYKNIKGFRLTDYTLSSGFLISLEVFNIVGPKDESLFIDLVDWEWCLRAKKKGYKTYINTGLLINHNLGQRHIAFLFFRFGVSDPIRHYYSLRNSLILIGRNYVPFKWKVKNIFLMIFKIMLYPIIMDHKYSRLKYMLLGVRGFIKKERGKFDGE